MNDKLKNQWNDQWNDQLRKPTEEIAVVKYKGDHKETVLDLVVMEHPLQISIQGKHFVTLLCTPSDLEELVLGHLYAAGVITKAENVAELVWHSPQEVDVMLAADVLQSGSGTADQQKGTDSAPALPHHTFRRRDLLARMAEFSQSSSLFLDTGGVHSCAIASAEELFHFSEDVGRHNAVDKVLGKMLRAELDLSDKFLLTSGRIASDLASKAVRRGIQMILSISAPTRDAVRLAQESGITLAGFVRDDRMNVYCHEHRIQD